MADLSLNVRGKDEGASDALKSTASSLGAVRVAAAGAAAAFVAFSKDSVKAFEEASRADRQLERAAGDLAGAFSAQAEAMQATLGVSDSAVKTMQAMLLRYGAAPATIEATTRALLDYSAATGEDAIGATQKLIASVEGGKVAFKDLGVAYDVTGRKSKDLEAAAAGLAKVVGGSADAEAASLTGSANRATEQFGRLQETWGGLVASFVEKTGVVDSARIALEALTRVIAGPSAAEQREDLVTRFQANQKWIEANKDLATSQDVFMRRTFEGRRAQFEQDLAAIEKIDAKAKAVLPTTALGGGDDLTNKAREEQKRAAEVAAKDARAAAEKEIEERYRLNVERNQQQKMMDDEFDDLLKDQTNARQKHEDEIGEIEADRRVQQEVFRAHDIEAAKKHQEELAKVADHELKKQNEALKKQEEQWAAAGAAVGGALMSSLTRALEKSIAGEEQDPAEVFADVLVGLLSMAASFIPGIGPFLAPIVGLGGAAVKGAIRSGKGGGIGGAVNRRHDGGWVDAPRYHGGAWVGTDEQPAILQNGERVLSRADVASMGGPRGVDSAVRGGRGGGVNIYVSTLDGGTSADYFARNGTAAMLKNYRLNRGIAWGGT